MIHDMSVGDRVYVFSETLDSVFEATIEGFSDRDRLRVKVLEETDDGYVRHIISWFYISEDRKEIEDIRGEYHSINGILGNSQEDYHKGTTVHLLKNKDLVRDKDGYPYLYQIIRVHKNGEFSLVNSYGEFIGRFKKSEIRFNSHEPIISSKDFRVGQSVSWVDEEAVYEGVVVRLLENKAKISNIKKLMPIDNTVSIDYYKLQSEDYPYRKDSVNILTSIVGDNIDSE